MSAAPDPVEVVPGDSPVILGLPHTGTWAPEDILARLNDRGCRLTDTDWHIHELYAGLLPGATTVRAAAWAMVWGRGREHRRQGRPCASGRAAAHAP